jgi:Tetratricopeptide repeat
VANQIATQPPPNLREAWPDAPPALVDLLASGMERRPEDRPASAGELAAGLRDALRAPQAPVTTMPRTPPPVDMPGTPPPVVMPRTPTAAPGLRLLGGRERRRWLPVAALAAVILAALVAVVALGGDDSDDGDAQRANRPTQNQRPAEGRESRSAPAEERAAEPAPAQPAPAPAEPEPAESEPGADSSGEDGAALNAEGFELMQQGRYTEAIPVLERAVQAFPEGTTDLDYAYALFNLGRSLRLAGRPDEAIPILERRLQIPNQTETVRRELAAARRSSKHP